MGLDRGGRRYHRILATIVTSLVVVGAAGPARSADDLGAVEAAFAATMASRDRTAFESFLDEEVVFFSGSVELRGKRAVLDAWGRFFDGEQAPFSWRPEVVSVLDSGTLGLTSGPVFDPAGDQIGTFNSIWRLNADGNWKIVFDRGCP